ncbi:hypothetical protein [Sulfuriflexus sp.]|uniref:hypothetical protein n=1 Tax=Sulfuriflexus sp. TaxID=2015443 RepID=UPI0028CF6F8E|nr:hypothetical protein [Sulfuriflexus sp.]MDT8404014.1 hypothetical protein [Sulfuriflexus sp.]
MILTAYINDLAYELDVPQDMLDEGESFFSKLDADMEKGWQMSREFVESPTRVERCKIVADRILDALSTGNRTLALLCGAYLLDRMPGIGAVYIDTTGDIMETSFVPESQHEATPLLNENEARARAEGEISNVYKVGRVYRYSVRNPFTGSWEEAPAVKTEEEAQRLREDSLGKRMRELMGRRISLNDQAGD